MKGLVENWAKMWKSKVLAISLGISKQQKAGEVVIRCQDA